MTSDSPNSDYTIQFTPFAREMLEAVKDQRELRILSDRIEQLKIEPEKQGKALIDKLSDYRSVRAVGQRYRIVYRVEQDTVLVFIVGVGRRKEGDKKDVYKLLERFLEQ